MITEHLEACMEVLFYAECMEEQSLTRGESESAARIAPAGSTSLISPSKLPPYQKYSA